LFWSETFYNVDTRALIVNHQKIAIARRAWTRARRRTVPLTSTADRRHRLGSNRTGSRPSRGRLVKRISRLYQPTEGYFDRFWQLPDFEQI